LIKQIDIPKFVEWTKTQKGYSMYNGKVMFYKFYFARLDKSIQNVEFKKFIK